MRKLTRAEITQVNNIPEVNDKKNYIQDLILQEWNKTGKGLIQCYTGFGKGHLIRKLIHAIHKKNPKFNFTVVVPTTNLKDDFESQNFPNTTVTTIHSFSRKIKLGTIPKMDVIIVDEAHTCANENSEFFSEVLPKTDYTHIFCTSATYEDNHLKYYKELGLEIIFDIPVEDGYKLKLVPEYVTYCLGVKLTPEEQRKYVVIQNEYDYYISLFSRYDIRNPTGALQAVLKGKSTVKYDGYTCTGEEHAVRIGQVLEKDKGAVIGNAMKWMGTTSKRASFLSSSENLVKGTLYILKRIKEKTIVFCGDKKCIKYLCDNLPGALPYHSGLTAKQNKENLRKFESGEALFLLTLKKLDAGYNLEDLRIGLQNGYTSKKLQFTQRSGRIKRYDKNNPNKVSVFICLYVDDFMYDGKLIKSQQKKWLQNSLKGRSFVEWIDNVDEIII